MKSLKKRMGKKGILGNLTGLIIGLGTIAILLAVVFLILSNVASNAAVVADANATLAVAQTTSAAAGIVTWLPLIVLVFIGAMLIMLVRGFGGSTNR